MTIIVVVFAVSFEKQVVRPLPVRPVGTGAVPIDSHRLSLGLGREQHCIPHLASHIVEREGPLDPAAGRGTQVLCRGKEHQPLHRAAIATVGRMDVDLVDRSRAGTSKRQGHGSRHQKCQQYFESVHHLVPFSCCRRFSSRQSKCRPWPS